jgi:F-type H+-transporting ATPase subunit b
LFSTFGINGKLLLMQAVNFGLLLLVLWKFVYRPVLAMIDERRAKIADGIAQAEAASRRLAEADEEARGLVGAAAKEGEGLVAAARERADVRAAEIVKDAEGKAAAALSDAQARAEEIKRQAARESEKDIIRASVLAAEKLLRERA